MRKNSKAGIIILLFVFIIFNCGLNLNTPSEPAGYALIYGVSIYGETPAYTFNLQYSDDDAISMDQLLTAKGYSVTTRINAEATKAQLLADLETLKTTVKTDDTVILYYSGHGGQYHDSVTGIKQVSDNAYSEWLLLRDSVDADKTILFEKAVYNDELAALLRDIPSFKKIVIIDACNSGGFIGLSPEIDSIPPDYNTTTSTELKKIFQKSLSLYTNYPPVSGSGIPATEAIVFSASGRDEESIETGLIGHGLFTYHFLETPSKADKNHDGYITLLESFNYITGQMRKTWNTRLIIDNQYLPHISGGPIDFVLFKSD
ncbi:MAG: caspase family protein [Spirochaetota bacterium]